jgi:hypothetical protein
VLVHLPQLLLTRACLWRRCIPGEASIHGGGVGGFRLVEAKYPALLFKQQLDALVQKIFPMMRDNVRKTITPLLVSSCLWHVTLKIYQTS